MAYTEIPNGLPNTFFYNINKLAGSHAKNQIKVMIQELKKKDINISSVYIKKIVNNEY